MRSLFFSACLAAGLAFVAASSADASERTYRSASSSYNSTSNSTASNMSTRSSVPATRIADDGPRFERKCVTMSCGTPWCYNARVN